MSRKRFIAPAFFTHADLYDAEAASGLPLRVCFAGLWTVADRRGVFQWSRNLKPRVLPYDPCDILACLDALEAAGFVMSYEVAGKRYGLIPTIGQHQSFHPKEAPSNDPEPPASLRLTNGEQWASRAASTSTSTTASTPTSTSTLEPEADPGFVACWEAYPKRAGGNSKALAHKAYRARISGGATPDELLAGTERYAAFVRATGREGTEYVKQAATFFGPGEHYREAWDPPVRGEEESPAQASVRRALELGARPLAVVGGAR